MMIWSWFGLLAKWDGGDGDNSVGFQSGKERLYTDFLQAP